MPLLRSALLLGSAFVLVGACTPPARDATDGGCLDASSPRADGGPDAGVCEPFSETCAGTVSRVCRADGSGYEDPSECDPVQGLHCDAAGERCVGACAPTALGRSYLGCNYYPTVIGNPVNVAFDYAVAVSNSAAESAIVTIEDGALAAPLVVEVGAGSVQVVKLPWQPELKLCNATIPGECIYEMSHGARVAKGAYHLRSTQPVTVYQFNSLEYAMDGDASFSNDASLLLPVNAWGKDYVAAAWPQFDVLPSRPATWPSLVAVTAAQDDTTVTIVTRARTDEVGDLPAFATGVPTQVTLARGEVIELAAFGEVATMPLADLTGSIIQADKPVQVVSGSFCAQVPIGLVACDHLEESMLPVETLGTTYLVTAPAVPPLPGGKEEVVRVIATRPGTTLGFDPPQAGVATTLAAPGDFVEIARQVADFEVVADQKVLVVQYMEGEEAGGDTGDPSMAQAVPIAQYRNQYLFHAPTSYRESYVNVTAPAGAHVSLDGVALAGFTAIGGSGYGVLRVPIFPGADGNHVISGDRPFGISVYGYGDFTSYWYPGGLDLGFTD